MKALVQRVHSAEVRVDDKKVGSIRNGLLVYLGIKKGDTTKEIEYLVNKIINLRVFEDDNGKMNHSLREVNGRILLVSQFTLYAKTKKGKRPDFTEAALPDEAKILFEEFSEMLNDEGFEPETGVFGADMQIESINDGPVNIIIEKNAE